MSADLEFRVNLPIIKIASSQSSDITDNVDSESCFSEEDDCHTPKSPEHMIPPLLSCPPAPRKAATRRPAAACKRKLWELDFFEIVAREEIESFFRMAEEAIGGGGGAAKRRCVM